MTTDIKSPENCSDMRDVRLGVDATDRAIMELLDRRYGYMRAAARIKQDRDAVRDEARKAEVIGNARTDARDRGLPDTELAEIWDRLVESSIAYEAVEWDRIRGRG